MRQHIIRLATPCACPASALYRCPDLATGPLPRRTKTPGTRSTRHQRGISAVSARYQRGISA
eukprot:946734-Prymnesium_polylepis.1